MSQDLRWSLLGISSLCFQQHIMQTFIDEAPCVIFNDRSYENQLLETYCGAILCWVYLVFVCFVWCSTGSLMQIEALSEKCNQIFQKSLIQELETLHSCFSGNINPTSIYGNRSSFLHNTSVQLWSRHYTFRILISLPSTVFKLTPKTILWEHENSAKTSTLVLNPSP